MAALAPAPAHGFVEEFEYMIGEEITMFNIDWMVEQRPDVDDSIVYPMDRTPSPIPPGWRRLVVFYKVDENNKSTIVWPAPYVMYGPEAPAPAPAPTIG
ncbi:hypothetical protein BDA96_05G056000 [Sorghum bicolor]|uniref:Uncharacterized protein n=1 Tax=Sorghum bicolor TaxID=4558 RepID=A0A921QXH2_SORBI|nr:hypothetical protein BDA96_05G056000 [Sorghum bicolor]